MMVEKMDKDGVKVIRVRDYPGAIASKIREEEEYLVHLILDLFGHRHLLLILMECL